MIIILQHEDIRHVFTISIYSARHVNKIKHCHIPQILYQLVAYSFNPTLFTMNQYKSK